MEKVDDHQTHTLSFKVELSVKGINGAPRIMREWIPTRLSNDLHELYNEYLLKTVFPDAKDVLLVFSTTRSVRKLQRRGYIDHMYVNPHGFLLSTLNKQDKKWNSPFTPKAMVRLNYGKLGVLTYNMKNDPRWISATIIAAFITGLVNIIVTLLNTLVKQSP